jgi:hypothetical protein
MKKIILLLLLCLSFNLLAQESDNSTLDTVKEVFLKGSIDGDNMFMVLGTADGYKISKKMIEKAIKFDDLVDLGEDAEDVVDAAKGFQNVLKKPWKSLKKIPKSYKVNFNKAQEAYYSANNQVSGVVKYSGWAVWAQVEGAYYLVIETPIVAAAQIIGHSIAVAWEIADLGIRLAWDLVKVPLAVIASAAVMTYSTVSSTIATTATLIAAGGVAVFKGGKWLLVTMPSKLFKPLNAEIETNLSYDQQEDFAKRIKHYIQNASDLFGTNFSVNSALGKFKSNFIINTPNKNGDFAKAYILNTVIKNKMIFLKIEISREFFRNYKKNHGDLTRKEIKEKLAREMTAILSQIINQA